MVSHIVVTEGLVFREDFAQNYFLSNYFEEVLKLVLKQVSETEKVYISPGNCFDCPESEEQYAAKYLLHYRPELQVFVPENVKDRPYLDTFDNARLLRKWLEQQEQWPLEEVILYCNQPHALRSKLMFKLCGYNVQQVITSHPELANRTMPLRLVFYHYLPAHLLYEWGALVYNLIRFYESKNSFKN
ncbi:YdcF family protein [Planktothrix agardhii 1033]|nr:YdcF family protein [Planktothrix agardhii 1033]